MHEESIIGSRRMAHYGSKRIALCFPTLRLAMNNMIVCANRFVPLLAVLIVIAPLLCGCNRKDQSKAGAGEVVLYTSVDEPYVRPLVEQFEKDSGIHVTLLTDTEASKSVGLAERLRAEKAHVQCDVWWSNECFLTIALAAEGALAPYESPAAAAIPAQYKDPDHRWAGSVLRVRTLVWSGQMVEQPTRLQDLLRPELKGQIAIARPTAGTTGGHVAALYVLWGRQRAEQFFHSLHDNGVKLLGGNSMVAESVARGDMRAGVCDNDDAASAAAEIGKLNSVLPDQAEGEDGTLAMPCTVALVANAPHQDAAKKLIDYLLSDPVGQRLIEAKFAWCSTRNSTGKGRFMKVDYAAVSRAMPAAIRDATSILEGR